MTQHAMPPGPGLPAAVQAVLFYRWPLAFVRSCERRYGSVFTVRVPELGRVVYVSDPDAVEALFSHDGLDAHAGAGNKLLEPVTGPESLLLLDGEAHRSERRLLAPAFHGAAIRALEPIIRQATYRELARWPISGVIEAQPAMRRITFEVITTAVLGVDDEVLRLRLLAELEPVFNAAAVLFLPFLRRDLGPWSPWGRFLRARRRLDATLFDIIAQRRGSQTRHDALGVLLATTDEDGQLLTDRHVRDEVLTLLLAGHETTTAALSWAIERLARHVRVQADARTELRDGPSELVIAIAAETLRVRPVIMDVARKLSSSLDIAGHCIPAGTTVMPGIYLMHLNAAHFDDPEEFNPQRFAERRPNRRSWVPFGGGRRRCIGAALAELELQIVLGILLSNYTLEPVSPKAERPRQRGVTFVPEHGGRVRVREVSKIDADRAGASA